MDEADKEAGEAARDDGGSESDEETMQGDGREVKWYLPDGLQTKAKPMVLDASLVGAIIFMRWENYGWLTGTISEKFTKDTPRLFAKYNFRVKWFDGWENHMLILDNYNHGPTAPFNSWVLLEMPDQQPQI